MVHADRQKTITISFIFAVIYLIAEYLRPQSLYSALASIPFGQLAIAGLIGAFIVEGRDFYNKNVNNRLILLYLFWFAVAYVFAIRRDLAEQPLIDFFKWVLIYFLLINTINSRARLYIFVIILLLLYFKYGQFATRIWVSNGFYSDPRGINAGGGIGAGFFQNPNDFGVAITSILGIAYFMVFSDKTVIAGFRMRWFHIVCAASLATSVIASSSRGAALGMAAAAMTIWFKSQRKALGVFALIAVSAAVIIAIPQDNWERFQKMGTAEDGSGQSRLNLWRAGIRMANEYPWTGVGPNNFIFVNTEIYLNEERVVQHNVYIQAASELGYPGLLLFLLMIYYCFKNQRRTRQLLKERRINDSWLLGLSHGLDVSLVGFAVNGFFITVLYYPFFWMLLILNVALSDIVQKLAAQHEPEPSVANIANTTT